MSHVLTEVVAEQPIVGIDTLVTPNSGSLRYVSDIKPAAVVERIYRRILTMLLRAL